MEKDIHPTVIVNAYFRALDELVKIVADLGVPINLENNDDLTKIV